MEADFWRRRWKDNDIAFHEEKGNSLLVKYFDQLSLRKGSRVFIPLCGKSRDIHWLLYNGIQVAGIELSNLAIEQLFKELGIQPVITKKGGLNTHSAQNIEIFGGDIFKLTANYLGPIDAIYDRAALVALPADVRQEYAKLLVRITNRSPQLLISYEYDQNLMDGPPFSIDAVGINKLYKGNYEVKLLESRNVEGGLKGHEAQEKAWLLK